MGIPRMFLKHHSSSQSSTSVIFLLQVGLTSNYVSDYQTVHKRTQGLEKWSCSIRSKTCFWDLWQWSRDCL